MRFSARLLLLAFGITLCSAIPSARSACLGSQSVAIPVETRTDEDIVYTPVANDLKTRIPVSPAFAAPIDTIKMQISNKINSGLVSGRLVSSEADEVQAALAQVALQEANLKLTYGCVNNLVVANLMPKYHMVNQLLDDLLANTNTADYLPSFGTRSAAIRDHIVYHEAAGNVTPSESEQLLAALAGINDQYVAKTATGGTLTADELEQSHADLFNLKRKLASRISAPLAIVLPEVVEHESDLLKTINMGIACHALSPSEARDLIRQYNRVLVLRQTIAADNGYASTEMRELTQEIDNLKFVVDREIHDRQVAGENLHY